MDVFARLRERNIILDFYLLQECEVVYANPVYNSVALVYNAILPVVVTNFMKPCGVWELLGAPAFQKVATHTHMDGEVVSLVGFKLVLRRIPNFFVLFIITP